MLRPSVLVGSSDQRMEQQIWEAQPPGAVAGVAAGAAAAAGAAVGGAAGCGSGELAGSEVSSRHASAVRRTPGLTSEAAALIVRWLPELVVGLQRAYGSWKREGGLGLLGNG